MNKEKSWEKLKERILNDLKIKGEIFIQDNLEKLEKIKRKLSK